MPKLKLRLRMQESEMTKEIPVEEAAVIIVDMWDHHWCRGALQRVNQMAPVMNNVIKTARNNGVQIIHAPAETMAYYAGTAFRCKMLDAPHAEPPPSRGLTSPALPFDDSDGGCDTGDPVFLAWSRQHPAISMEGRDAVTDRAREIYNFITQQGIRTLIYMGVHPNFCVLNRHYGIKQFTNWGVDCVLARDLVDVLYNPAMPPYLDHEQANDAIVRYIEKYWCPSITSLDLLHTV